MGLAERADVIVDFTNVPKGDYTLRNVGPDEPFGGGIPVTPPDSLPPWPELSEGQFYAADPASTGQVMEFRVGPVHGTDKSTPPMYLTLPAITPLPPEDVTRALALIEKAGKGVDASGDEIEGPIEALLGTVGPDAIDATVPDGVWTERLWMDPLTENPAVGSTEVWEFYNTTVDAHPMHVHEVAFEVVNREGLVVDGEGNVVSPVQLDGNVTLPEAWETGFKDTVTAYPGQVTRVRAHFKKPGQFVWHCHIVEHEDNEMMRPFRIGPEQDGQPGSMPPV
jgi:FtsP/CotA-like multicopper oxidase with cupredoxin domain